MPEKEQPSTKGAYILAQQLSAMRKSMEAVKDEVSGYPAYAKSFNQFLRQSKQLLDVDEDLKESVRHLEEFPTEFTDDVIEHFGCLRANCAILEASVLAFFSIYSPPEEKRQIGFRQNEA
jgi:hypothetical protein